MKSLFMTTAVAALLLGAPMAFAADDNKDHGPKTGQEASQQTQDNGQTAKEKRGSKKDDTQGTDHSKTKGNTTGSSGSDQVNKIHLHAQPDQPAKIVRSKHSKLTNAPVDRQTVTPTPPVIQSDKVIRNQQIDTSHAPNATMHTPPTPLAAHVDNLNPGVFNNSNVHVAKPRWSRGDRLPDQYRQSQYYVDDWQRRGFRKPPHGYRWVHDDNNNFFLTIIATGMIADFYNQDERDQRWRQRYSHSYSYNDDYYYENCRNQPDPAGVLVGGFIGGLIGNAAGNGGNRTGTTLAGVILGGALGAALTNNMDCEDRSYAYKSYYDGFNSGNAGYYNWHNPHNDHRGEFRVRSYYNDPDGFRCARFSQVTYIQGHSYNTSGVACRQPDGSWAVVN